MIHMQHTRQIDATEVSKYFKKLDETKDLRNEASSCLWDRDPLYRPNIDATYYVVSDENGEDLLFIRTILKKGVFNFLEIAFCRISQKSHAIKYEWLKTAIEEKILPESIKKDANEIRAIPVTHELEVYRQLQNYMPIYDSDHNWVKVEIIDDSNSPSAYRLVMRVTQAYNDSCL